ncbi:MAG: undecaprenyl-diphosphate phosphatase [Lachnospiraceae bacterium]|nr:undecaprenyl-diphosphate phosphatase [Lachnospiraceae bacterium]
MLDILKAVLYGIVEGITEWLPISSTGHLILLEKLIPFEHTSPGFFDMFDVVIQLGAILAVVFIYWKKLFPFAFSKKDREQNAGGGIVRKDIFLLWGKILVACVPAAVIGILFDDFFNEHFYNEVSVAVALIVFGIIFILVEKYIVSKGNVKASVISEITFMMALEIGIFQILAAAFPGTSRSGATIIGALLIGVSRQAAAEFTFYLAVPVMLGASLLKLLKFGFEFSPQEISTLLMGFFVSFAVSVVALRFFIGYIKKHDFKPFGWYRIALGIIVLLSAAFL